MKTASRHAPLRFHVDAISSVAGSSFRRDGAIERAREETEQVQAGDREAFEVLARENLPRLYSLARRLAGDEAEDLVQECLLNAYRSFGSLHERGAGPKWLQSILVNAFRDRLRKAARTVQEVGVDDIEDFSLYRTIAEDDPLPYSDTLHLDFLRAFGREDIHEVVQRLPAIYRAPLVLCYIDGYATKEIARMLDLPIGTVLAQLHRGRKLFEREMWSYAEATGLLARETSQ